MQLIHYGRETVNVNGREYLFSDLLKIEPKYQVPHGFGTRVYRKDKDHYITDGMMTLYLPLDDPYCNRICDREGELARLVALLELESKKKPTA